MIEYNKFVEIIRNTKDNGENFCIPTKEFINDNIKFMKDNEDKSDPNANANFISPVKKKWMTSDKQYKTESLFTIYRYLDSPDRDQIMRNVINNRTYIHDLSDIRSIYCVAISLRKLAEEGYESNGVRIVPKNHREFTTVVIEAMSSLANYCMGAIAPSDFFVLYAQFIEKAGREVSDSEIMEDLMRIVLAFNNENRTAGQSPFTNFSMFSRDIARNIFKDYEFDLYVMLRVQELYAELMRCTESGIPYRFPVSTFNINKSDDEFLDYVSDTNSRLGNFNIYLANSDDNKVSMCCRFVNDLDRIDSFGNGGIDVGSSRVIAINLPHLAYLSRGNPTTFLEILKDDVGDIIKLHEAHRKILEDAANNGYNKFIKPLGIIKLMNLFATIGIVGIYEAVEILGLSYNMMEVIIKTIKEEIDKHESDLIFNVEEVPGEGACVKMAKSDREFFGKEVQKYSIYSNQFVPLHVDMPIEQRIKISAGLVNALSGGGICHINVPKLNPAGMKQIILLAIKYGLPHLAVNYGFTQCEDDHILPLGNVRVCQCGKPIKEIWSRIIGYFVPVSSWSQERQVEFYDRKWNGVDEFENS